MTDFATLLQQGNSWLFVPSAVVLGALHGLEPGHSKTMMAAFIVAIGGTLAQWRTWRNSEQTQDSPVHDHAHVHEQSHDQAHDHDRPRSHGPELVPGEAQRRIDTGHGIGYRGLHAIS